ncbi:lysozyme inhibitor LprI family protein [Aliarcobacter cryaerophilus]|uniref:lysozyme inhibitor LprI family protein n=1 Tax=Aliarcobacter cryaerophilus TaxID=28198 RepID=UPI0015E831BB|nr:lysozyme inhibitor LprI family protein [Aliarcobacter cryaerophilus]
MINRLIKIGFSASLLITSIYAASFDCKKASTFIENTICNDTELSKLDDELAKAYKKVWNSMSDKTELKKEQFDWLKNSRDKCMSLECLKTSYTNRVLYLTNYDSKGSQVNTTVDFSDILGVYSKGEASITVNQDLSFEYTSVNESTGNLCSIENEKFIVENGSLVWNSEEFDCKIQVSKSNKDSINFNSSGDGCFSYCGVNAYFVNGMYKKEKNRAKQQTSNVNEPAKEQKVESYKFVASDDLESFPSDYIGKMLSLSCKTTNVGEDEQGGGYDINPVCKDSKGKYGFMGFNPFKIKVKTYDKNLAREIAKSENKEKYFFGVLKVDNSQFAITKHIFEIHEVRYK